MGKDPSGLGRWCYTLLEGKQHSTTRIVSVYQPTEGPGESSINSQHVAYLREKNDMHAPRKAIYEDLQESVDEWLENGENLIICIDTNEDVLKGDTKRFFKHNHMEEVILQGTQRETISSNV